MTELTPRKSIFLRTGGLYVNDICIGHSVFLTVNVCKAFHEKFGRVLLNPLDRKQSMATDVLRRGISERLHQTERSSSLLPLHLLRKEGKHEQG